MRIAIHKTLIRLMYFCKNKYKIPIETQLLGKICRKSWDTMLSTDNRQQTTDNRQQTTDNRQQTTVNRGGRAWQQTTGEAAPDNRQQSTDNGQQTTDNGQQTTEEAAPVNRQQSTVDRQRSTVIAPDGKSVVRWLLSVVSVALSLSVDWRLLSRFFKIFYEFIDSTWDIK